MFVHTVFFWLKDGAPAGTADRLIADCRDFLGRCPTARNVWAGPPAQTPRDVVDNSYACGLTVLFENRADQDAYQDDPIHNEFIERNREHWSRVQVYDFEDTTG